MKILGTSHVRSLQANIGRCHRDLITLEGFQTERVSDVLGINLHSHYQENKYKLNGPFSYKYTDHFFLRPDLAFCIECLKKGFHSLFHQWKLLNYCPFHMTPLTFSCPVCHQHYLYEVTDIGFHSAFVCKCGKSHIEDHYVRFFYKNWGRDLVINCNKLNAWLSFDEPQKQKLQIIHFFTEQDLHKTPTLLDGIFGYLGLNDIDLLNHYTQIKSTSTIKEIKGERERAEICTYSTDCYPKMSEYSLKKLRFQVLQADLFESYSHILSSIARQLRKTVLMKHKTCIERYYSNSAEDSTCPFAFAYLHWRSFIQGFKSPQNVTTEYKYPKRGDSRFVNFPFAYRTEFFEKVFEFWRRHVEDITLEPRAALKWVLGRCIAHFAISYFWTWLSFAEKLIKKYVTVGYPPFEYEFINPFFLVLPLQGDGPFEFHWNNTTDKQTIIDHPSCPFQTVKSRRDPRRKGKIAYAKQFTHYYSKRKNEGPYILNQHKN
ncbi:UNVERIFIED_CONTAM: hypothetical protein ABID98_001831 [Brevibacillus sp. OAP136]